MQFTSVVLSALALLSGARALQLNNPINAVSGEPLEISWKFRPEDPNFSLELFSPTLHDTFALADDVNPSDNAIVVTLPDVPTGSAAGQYFINAVAITDVNEIFAQTSPFTISSPS